MFTEASANFSCLARKTYETATEQKKKNEIKNEDQKL